MPQVSQEPLFLDRSGVFRRSGRSEMSYVCVPIRAEHRTAGALGVALAVPEGPLLRPRGQVLRPRGLDDRPGGARAPPGRGREEAPARREHQAAARAHRALRHPQPGRQQPADADGLRAGGAGRAREHHRAAARRVGHRQGAGGARDPLLLAARQEALRQGELRGAAREPDRVGAVRLRAGGLHRRAHREEGPLRARPRRHDLPRRDRRAGPGHAGQAAAGAAGARDRAARRRRADQAQRAGDRRHQQGPRGGGQGGHASARTSTTG